MAAQEELVRALDEAIALLDLPLEGDSPSLSDIRELSGGLGIEFGDD